MISMWNGMKIKKTSFLLKLIKNLKVPLKVKAREITSNIRSKMDKKEREIDKNLLGLSLKSSRE